MARQAEAPDTSYFPKWANQENYKALYKLDLLGWFLNLRARYVLWETRTMPEVHSPAWDFLRSRLREDVIGNVLIPTEEDRSIWESKGTVWTAAHWEIASLGSDASYGDSFFMHDERMNTLNQRIVRSVERERNRDKQGDEGDNFYEATLEKAYRAYGLGDKYAGVNEGFSYPLVSAHEQSVLFAGVNLANPNETIIEDFKNWLKMVKSIEGETKKPWEKQWQNLFAEWSRKNIIQWLDIHLWSLKEGVKVKHRDFYHAFDLPDGTKFIEKNIKPSIKDAMGRLWELRQAL